MLIKLYQNRFYKIYTEITGIIQWFLLLIGQCNHYIISIIDFSYKNLFCFVSKGPSDETEPVLLVGIYNRYYVWSCNGYIVILIVFCQRKVYRHNLRKSSTGFIQTQKELFDYVQSSMLGIKRFYYVDQNDLKQSRDCLVKIFNRSKVIKETK